MTDQSMTPDQPEGETTTDAPEPGADPNLTPAQNLDDQERAKADPDFEPPDREAAAAEQEEGGA